MGQHADNNSSNKLIQISLGVMNERRNVSSKLLQYATATKKEELKRLDKEEVPI